MTTVRIDNVTLALFRHLGVTLEEWSDRLRKTTYPVMTKGIDMTPYVMTNLCSEIRPGGAERSELDSYHYVDEGPLPNAPAGMDTARICGGKVQLATGVYYKAPGRGLGERRETGLLMVHRQIPDTLVQGLIGGPADAVVDHPVLAGVWVVNAEVLRNAEPNAFFSDHVAFGLAIEWTKVEVDRELARHSDTKE